MHFNSDIRNYKKYKKFNAVLLGWFDNPYTNSIYISFDMRSQVYVPTLDPNKFLKNYE